MGNYMGIIRREGIITPMAPVIHGAPNSEKRGRDNHSPGRRLPVKLQPKREGEGLAGYRDLNVISGNGIRGHIRRIFARHTLEMLCVKEEELPKETVYLLFVGGATGAGLKLDAVTEHTILEVREKLPFVNLLGGTINGHFIGGTMRVDIAYPYLVETEWMDRVSCRPAYVPTYNEFEAQVLKDVQYTRYKPNTTWKNEGKGEAETIELDGDEPSGGEENSDNVRMLYSAEAIPAGTDMLHGFAALPTDENTKHALDAFMTLFMQNGYVGGWSRAGHGKFKAQYYDALSCEEFKPSLDNYHKYLENNKKEIKDMLKNLPSKFPVKKQDTNSSQKGKK